MSREAYSGYLMFTFLSGGTALVTFSSHLLKKIAGDLLPNKTTEPAMMNSSSRVRVLEDHESDHLHQYAASENHNKPWGDVILGTVLVQLVAFSGLAFALTMRFCFGSRMDRESIIYRILVPTFSMGAIFATAIFLLIPESIHMLMIAGEMKESGGDERHHQGGDREDEEFHRYLEDGHGHEGHGDESFAWKFGLSLIMGFFFPAVVAFAFPGRDTCYTPLLPPASNVNSMPEDTKDATAEEDNISEVFDGDDIPEEPIIEKDDDMKTQQEGCTADECNCTDHEPSYNWRLAATVLFGDACCNFTDGFFIGTGFLLCDKSVGYTLVATTVYHELAQEIADYMILTQKCGFEPWKALLANLLVGGTVIIGAVLVMLLDLSEQAIGIILAVSAGVYLYICGTELMPRIQRARKHIKDTTVFFFSFTIGCFPIGLVLLNHGHCEPEDEQGEH